MSMYGLFVLKIACVIFQNLVTSSKMKWRTQIDTIYYNRMDLWDASYHLQKINVSFECFLKCFWNAFFAILFHCALYLVINYCYVIVYFFQHDDYIFATRRIYGTIFVRSISDAGISKINSLRVDQHLPRLLSVGPRLSYFSSFYETNGKIKKAKRICLGKQRRRLDGQDSRGKLWDRGQRRVLRRVCARVELCPWNHRDQSSFSPYSKAKSFLFTLLIPTTP